MDNPIDFGDRQATHFFEGQANGGELRVDHLGFKIVATTNHAQLIWHGNPLFLGAFDQTDGDGIAHAEDCGWLWGASENFVEGGAPCFHG